MDAREARSESNHIGLIDWAKSLGIPEALYHPETLDLIDTAQRQCPDSKSRSTNYDAVFRGAVEYKKGLTEKALAALPPNLSDKKPFPGHHDVELVLLELIKVAAVCDK